tara:strand:+ start:1265 stop:2557 length:1293 start_codon:yes stop_codon:yes gene_type:complete
LDKYLKIQNLPFYITLSSLFLPLFVVQTGLDAHRLLLVFVYFVYMSWTTVKGILFKSNKILFYYLIFFIFLFSLDIVNGRGLRNFSYSHIFLYTFVFLNIFYFLHKMIKPEMLYSQINTIFKIILVALVIELLFLISGNFDLLQKIYPDVGASTVQGFRSYHNRFATFFNLNFDGLNSLITGNQIANTLAVLSMIWFSPFYENKPFKNKPIWFFISVILFFVSPNMTGAVLVVCYLVLLFTILNNVKVKKINNFLPIFLALIFLSLLSYRFIFLPLFDPSMLFYYIYIFVTPVLNYISMDLIDIIYGHNSINYAARFYSNEIGLIRVAMVIGLPLIILTFTSFFFIFKNSNNLFSKTKIKKVLNESEFNAYTSYAYLSQVSITLVIIWFISTFHYLTVFRLGSVQIISFLLSISIFSLSKSETIFKRLKK